MAPSSAIAVQKMLCRKFSQFHNFACKTDWLPLKHTFYLPNKLADRSAANFDFRRILK
jgi:hypothetical protein